MSERADSESIEQFTAIVNSYWDHGDDRRVEIKLGTLRAVLSALAHPLSSTDQVK